MWKSRIGASFSALQRAEIAEIETRRVRGQRRPAVSVLFNEPKLLKLSRSLRVTSYQCSFSALQRAEIAEMFVGDDSRRVMVCFSALQRAEIAEMEDRAIRHPEVPAVSVLFNEPKLLKSTLYRHHQDLVIYYFCTI